MNVKVTIPVVHAFDKDGNEYKPPYTELVLGSYYPSVASPRIVLMLPDGGSLVLEASDLQKAVERAAVRQT